MRYFEVRKARIEIIPMIDIMFFLLIFFIMFTLHMIPSKGLSSNLPHSSTAQTLPHPQVIVDLNTQGQIEVDSHVLSPDQLTSYLAHTQDPQHTVVTIAGAGDTSLQHLMTVMDACRRAGVSQIGLAARENHS